MTSPPDALTCLVIVAAIFFVCVFFGVCSSYNYVCVVCGCIFTCKVKV